MEFNLCASIDPHTVSVDWDSEKRIGIMLSGGLDSAVLLSAMLHAARESGKKLNIQPFTVIKTEGGFKYVSNIIPYLRNEFGLDIPDTKLVGDGTLHHTQINMSAYREIFGKDLSDVVYIGTNQIPPEIFPGLAPVRVQQIDTPKIKAPLLHGRKNHTVDLAIQLGQQKLFEMTHSCTEQAYGSCNRCWQCHERAWGFKQLGLADPALAPDSRDLKTLA
jgi:hypothetical protein